MRDHGLVVVSREGSDPQGYVAASALLTRYRDNIHIVRETIPNDGQDSSSSSSQGWVFQKIRWVEQVVCIALVLVPNGFWNDRLVN